MTEYCSEPLWVRREGDDIHLNTSPSELGLSASLVGRLDSWRLWGESFINFADPAHDSRVVSDVESAAFDAEGRLLTRRVADELPGGGSSTTTPTVSRELGQRRGPVVSAAARLRSEFPHRRGP